MAVPSEEDSCISNRSNIISFLSLNTQDYFWVRQRKTVNEIKTKLLMFYNLLPHTHAADSSSLTFPLLPRPRQQSSFPDWQLISRARTCEQKNPDEPAGVRRGRRASSQPPTQSLSQPTNKTPNQQSASQLISQPTSQSTTQPASQPASKPVSQPTTRQSPASQPINQPPSQSPSQPSCYPNLLVSQSAKRSILPTSRLFVAPPQLLDFLADVLLTVLTKEAAASAPS